MLTERIRTDTLVERVTASVRRSTHNRIRNLSVEEIQGRYVVAGQVASQHMKQMALHGALECLSGEQFASEITVERFASRSVVDA